MANLSMINQSPEAGVQHKPEPAETFEIEFLNVRGQQIRDAMLAAGGFKFRGSGLDENGNVYYIGGREDGTKINITLTKGQEYRTPAQIASEKQEQSK